MGAELRTLREEMDRAIAGRTLCSAFADTVAKHADAPALRWKDASGAWQGLTWGQYREKVRAMTLALRELGLGRGDFAVIQTRNRPEHVIADLAILHAGATPVSLYNTLSPEQIAYVAGHCEAKVAIVEDGAFLARFREVSTQLPKLKYLVVVEPEAAAGENALAWCDLEARGAKLAADDDGAFEASWRAVQPDDLATLVYTSGTTGPPKGVMDTHRALFWMFEAYARLEHLEAGGHTISYLPLAHAAERTGSHWLGLVHGWTTTFCPDPTKLLEILREVRPTRFVGVPRVWEKLHAGIQAGIAADPDESRRTLVRAAIAAGVERVRLEQAGKPVPADLAARLTAVAPVFEAIRAKIGLDRVERAAAGAAPSSREVLEFFHALGVAIYEVWGMSELACVGTAHPIGHARIGKVGRAMPGVELRIADDGELLYRAPNVMKGYYKEPEKTAEAVDGDGWLHTGDIATIDDEGYVAIVDRKKELIITAGGKNISPANLEAALVRHPLVGQAMAVGDRRAFITALVVLDPEVAPAWARARGITATGVRELASHPEVLAEIDRAVAAANEHFSRVEQIKRHTVLADEWTPASGELTPTMKLKRRVIHEKYAHAIEAMYAAD
ncbi:MAG TPA: long-chain fatty acid--CoA ligase [Polyangiaceae bacterium]